MRLLLAVLGLSVFVGSTHAHTRAHTCSNGVAGVEGLGMCCVAECGTCGGKDCRRRASYADLPADACCSKRIRDSGILCSASRTAPCIIDSEPSKCNNGLPGVENGGICCSEECGTCGGRGCKGRPGGRDGCCTAAIADGGVMCSESGAAPCVMDNEPSNGSSFCSNDLRGVEKGEVCCLEECGTCGGHGCKGRPGGRDGCCTRAIADGGVMCSESGAAPCIVDNGPSIEPTPCNNGFRGVERGDVCCSEECGVCGGSGCKGRPGGRERCCTGVITDGGVMCSESGTAPCIMDGGVPSSPPASSPTIPPTPVPTVAPSVSHHPATSVRPTVVLSVSPTAAPSVGPTVLATSVGPSVAPSVSPSAAPSVGPTVLAPSVGPSVAPSVGPSAAPSIGLTAAPSLGPSAAPSSSPTAEGAQGYISFTGYASSNVSRASLSGVYYLSAPDVRLVNLMEVLVLESAEEADGQGDNFQVVVVDGVLDEVFDVSIGQGFKVEYNETSGNFTVGELVTLEDERRRRLAPRALPASCVNEVADNESLEECVERKNEEFQQAYCEELANAGGMASDMLCSWTVGRRVDKGVCSSLPELLQAACRKFSDVGESVCEFVGDVADSLFYPDCDNRRRRLQGLSCPASGTCTAGPVPELLPNPDDPCEGDPDCGLPDPPAPSPVPETPEPPFPAPSPTSDEPGGTFCCGCSGGACNSFADGPGANAGCWAVSENRCEEEDDDGDDDVDDDGDDDEDSEGDDDEDGDDKNRRGGQSTGDPHLLTFDGNWFDCQGRGEFVLVKAAATETEVQVRYEPPSAVSGVSLTTGIAASENGSSLVQLTTSDGGGLLVDGAPYDEITGVTAGVDLVISTSSVEMNFASGLNVIAAIRIGYYDISVFAPLTLATTGLLGNNNGEIADDWTTQAGENVTFASPSGPTVIEGTEYCTTNWCTTSSTSIFTYANGESHGTYDFCDMDYASPELPDVVPDAVIELCGDNAECTFDAIVVGTDVAEATLQTAEEFQVYQEEVGGICASNTFSSTGAPPCTACPTGEVSGAGATTCTRRDFVGLDIPDNIAAAMVSDAPGGFAGPGTVTGVPDDTIVLTADSAGSFTVTGNFQRTDGVALPSTISVFMYIENADQPDDFVRGQAPLNHVTGDFTGVVTDVPVGSSRLFLSFVVLFESEALSVTGADTVFAFDLLNDASCDPSLTITLEWSDDNSDVDLFVTEPGGTTVSYQNALGNVGLLDNDNTAGFGPENYIILSGLDTDSSQVLGEYSAYVQLYSGTTESWRLTARVSGEVLWVEEGDFASSSVSSTFTVSLDDYDPSCGSDT